MRNLPGALLRGTLMLCALFVSAVPAQELTSAVFRDCLACPEMVVVPAGEFLMGADHHSRMRGGEMRFEGPVRVVRLPADFAVGRFEVTVAEFAAFVEDSAHQVTSDCRHWSPSDQEPQVSWRRPYSERATTANEPVVCVSWHDARAYVAWLSRKTGLGYRLLTEAEWAYAALGGSPSTWPWGESIDPICRYANVFDRSAYSLLEGHPVSGVDGASAQCSDGFPGVAPVGQLQPNAFGLHDMVGNVWEWVADCSVVPYPDGPLDGSAVQVGGRCEKRAIRSGSWRTRLERHRPNFRGRDPANTASDIFGFRVARDLPEDDST
jgi:formylglycine-generating enzyme required for sulfatase activity